ncbi:MAG TPA: hypothetical protein VFX45_05740 [Solirubrobacterales bacterium]|nr:hypothetical protein [Solirubrobacterales bacterium]
MAVAAPARKTAPAPAPSRTTPPRRRKPAPARPASPRTKAAPARRAAATAPARRAPARRAPTRRAPARAPQRARPKTRTSRVAAGGQLIPIAVGRTAVAMRQLPDSGLMVRMTRGRAWIGVLGVLLAGIVTLNVITLSFAASSGQITEQITTLEKENSVLGGREAQRYATERIRYEAGALGLTMSTDDEPQVIDAGADDVAQAAARLAAAG